MSYQLLLTNAGATKIATASNAGGTPLHITDFAVGQGVNVDFSTRLDKQTLVAKRYQGKVESVNLVAPNKYEIVCVVPVDVGGFTIREFGLIDSDGVLVWVGSLPEVQKPDATNTAAVDYRLKAVVQIDNPQVSIVIDANAITATQSWVNSTISKEFADFQALFNSWQQSVNQDLALVKNRKIEPVSIGGLLITTRNYANSQEVHDGEGYGKWTKFSEGQLLLGIGSHTDKNGVTKNISMMQQLGEYEHQLTIDEMPSHKHGYGSYGGVNGTGSAATADEPWEGEQSDGMTLATGGNQPHNNIQPSIGVGMWLRLPNDYTATSFDIYFTSDALGQNRVSQINEDSAIYLWIDVANATVPIAVSGFNQQGAGDFISDGANLTYPPTINNGKNLMVGVLPENYHVDMQTIIDWGFTLFDATIGKTQNIHAGLTINDTVSDVPPYNGMKFEIYITNDRGRIKCVPKVLENNSPFIVEACDPFTEAEGCIKISKVPTDLAEPSAFFIEEQTPVNGYSDFKLTNYLKADGEMYYVVPTVSGADDFRNGLIPDGTLINTVKLTYQP
jgi:hypothetical protein